MNRPATAKALIRHEETAPRERSTCGWRHLLISRQDDNVAALATLLDEQADVLRGIALELRERKG